LLQKLKRPQLHRNVSPSATRPSSLQKTRGFPPFSHEKFGFFDADFD